MAGDDNAGAAADAKGEASPPPPLLSQKENKRRGILSRVWRAIFGGSEDYEKRLQYLSKEEASVHTRLKRRAQSTRRMVRNLIVLSVLAEVVAVIYAIMTTRSLDLSWQLRAVRVLPMFVLPALASIMYSTIVSFTRMLDRKDQKTLEKLRAERKAKIDELKERTNYYTTQQLIQKYDLDPAAKAAAATVLASKLGADSGLKFYVDEPKENSLSANSSDIELVQSSGLRNRKVSQAKISNTGGAVTSQAQPINELASDAQEAHHHQKVVEHYKGSSPNDGGWLARIAALLVGEDPSQCYALICGHCHMHNGLARKEDFPHIKYYCPHCHTLNASNASQLMEEQASGISSGTATARSSDHAKSTPNTTEESEDTKTTGQNLLVTPTNDQEHVNETN